MANKKPRLEVRWKEARISPPISTTICGRRSDFLAGRDHRPLSNYVEFVLVEHVRDMLENNIGDFGDRKDNRPWEVRITAERIEQELRRRPSGMGSFPPKKR